MDSYFTGNNTMSLNKSSPDLILDLINANNSSVLTFDNVTFNTPVVLIGDVSERNTTLRVESVPWAGYHGTVPIKYNRVSLALLTEVASVVIELDPDDPSEEALVESINNEFGVMLSLDSDVTTTYNVEDVSYEPKEVTITSRSESLAWLNGFNATVSLRSTEIPAAVSNHILPGLPPVPPKSFKDISVVTTLPVPVAESPVALIGNKLHIAAGRTDVNTTSATMYILDTETLNLETLANTTNPIVSKTYMAATNTNLYILGGVPANRNSNVNNIQRFNIPPAAANRVAWATLESATNRSHGAWDEGQFLYVRRGWNSSFRRYAISNAAFTNLAAFPIGTIGGGVMGYYDGSIYYLSGWNTATAAYSNRIYRYIIATNTWSVYDEFEAMKYATVNHGGYITPEGHINYVGWNRENTSMSSAFTINRYHIPTKRFANGFRTDIGYRTLNGITGNSEAMYIVGGTTNADGTASGSSSASNSRNIWKVTF